jgi:hypothetical protein
MLSVWSSTKALAYELTNLKAQVIKIPNCIIITLVETCLGTTKILSPVIRHTLVTA